MPLKFFQRSFSQNEVAPEKSQLSTIPPKSLLVPLGKLSDFQPTLSFIPSQRTLTDLPSIPEGSTTELFSDAAEHTYGESICLTQSANSNSTILTSDIIENSFKLVSIDDAVSASSSPPMTKEKKFLKQSSLKNLSLFKFLKNSKVNTASIEKSKIKEKPKKSEIVGEEQVKQTDERDRRLKEVLDVMERKKVLPKGMEKYRFVHFIGDGTYGFVVTALNEHNTECAIKFIFKEKVPVTAWVRDIDLGTIPSEIHLLKSLSHPNIIKFIEYFEDENYVIMITELHGTSWDSTNPLLNAKKNVGLKSEPRKVRVGSDGKGDAHTLASLSSKQRQLLKQKTSCDLFECIDAHNGFPEHIARKIFRQVASAVLYLHENGIVHRDLKDENIVISDNYDIKLIDFGSAAYVPTAAKDYFDKFLGTLDFAAPEIIEGFRYRGPEAEVWALGVLLYIIVCRNVPFKTNDDIARADFELILPKGWKMGDALESLLRCMLERNCHQRITIQDVMTHPWVVGPLSESSSNLILETEGTSNDAMIRLDCFQALISK